MTSLWTVRGFYGSSAFRHGLGDILDASALIDAPQLALRCSMICFDATDSGDPRICQAHETPRPSP